MKWWAWSFLCVGLAVTVTLPAPAQETKDPAQLQVVKYGGLKDVIHKNRGKVILVDFWADYCIPCKKGFPHVIDMHKKYARDGLVTVSVSLDPIDDPGSRENAARFLKKAGAEFTNLYLDEPVDVWQKKLGFAGPPCYFVFNRQGQWTKFEPQENEPIYEALDKFVVERLREK
jgi:thiol-disulfide isomerase/thioredoxin